MSRFVEKLRAHAEAKFGESNAAAIESWLQYWSSTVERNQAILQFFRSKLNLNLKGKCILDVGCGTAGLSQLVTREDGTYLGCDFFEKTLAFGKAFTSDLPEGAQASLVRASAIELPFGDGSIDAAIGFDVIEHLVGGETWQLQFLCEICRVLRHDGILLLTTPNRLCPFEGHTFLIGPQFLPVAWADRYIRHLRPQFFREYQSYAEVHLLMPWRLKALLRQAGLAPLHELPWCTDRRDYRTATRWLLKACHALHLDWAVFYKFQIAAARQESVSRLQLLKRAVKNESFFPEPGLLGLLKKGLALLARR
ncbi:MAG: class I SAM-dependent methyltransferase [Acidobacteria bacterium]|nr:class I SAM-dependent methyltransferase [Acidobacteriota bacterium]